MNKFFRNLFIILAIFLVVSGIFMLFSGEKEPQNEVTLGKLADEVIASQVSKIEVADNNLTIYLKDGTKQVSTKEQEAALSDTLRNNYSVDPAKIKEANIVSVDSGSSSIFVSTILPFVIPFLFIAAFIWFLMRQVQGSNNRAMSFGQSGAKLMEQSDRRKRITFGDVAGIKEAKEELKEIVEFLRFPQKFFSLGARIPKGVLLLGPPGVGKTLVARAVAGEANVPFFHISGSEFVEMFVGVGASRVRDLFKRAKKNAPCIIFIDEIDAVGRQRGAGLGGSHDEREQTLNQILVEMDGFENETNVIVIAATNRPDVLDPALLRPGRFDRQVILDQPDINDREAILKIHGKNKPWAKDVNIRKIAERTPGFSGADLANLINEAAILAARRNLKEVTQSELTQAIEKVMLGPERKSHLLTKKEKEIVAWHEAGHALVATVLDHADPVHKVSIVSRGRAGGFTMKLPTEDKNLHSKSEFLADIAVSLGGYATEQMIFNELTTGASNDLKVATALARKLITSYGMSETLGPMTFGDTHEMVFLGREISESKNYSEKVAAKIDEEVSGIIERAHRTATDILKKYRKHLTAIAHTLMKQETLERDEFETLVADIIPKHKIGKKEEISLPSDITATATA
ncbi:MAG: cell division protein FtsH [Candidatus Doudnabacteria bacterium RIFCSPLOWO2_02_FULL_42_9]|uniref:ATP-dependent zinc metalloprotease FtsH n=1 Tax=Candidatus Doudnabacteria bacterium RIFCSPHIGHO2_01_FULL_41_86 TaxID=1817821 RepID=A0A1F5N8U9_9BACT|nr:MAG: cell division protein FtsH [Candidatus Doudnabacteria bacterium RIFCSPHIGHO2_01_FULL_41_86]OGE75777.1 MAG: cell division protein FtsH [Candidatus Doudnabacteria bacterium RIFCSPHIGHO2_01_43_10]OGE86439.1 MAG: cell division protein FtsH [Candidatus Doudnabacteria bacterium RIFCSPHIGHO2_12_FULL_42_22]OGE87438.1 MAG: cell division protein FtsH [Candidatus Doudnabacteria bacterium RIFCSPHIGHO2_02_FULL_42_25]OGE92736.1 MAG: cell division protein FtsH [Candidatus Doudnabacteria bacterium RIFC